MSLEIKSLVALSGQNNVSIIWTEPFDSNQDTVYYYNEFIIRPDNNFLKTIAIEGVKPTEQTITNRLYPYTTEVYAVMRSDTDKSSITYKVYELLQTETGMKTIINSGYIPN